MGDLTLNFDSSEFKCPCCGEANMDFDFMRLLQRFRDELGVKFSPVKGGGYRCAKFNGSETGAHVEGKAVDPGLGREHYHKALTIALKLGFSGIGIKQKSGKFQLHMDTADEIPGKRPRPWVWTY